MKFLGQKGVSDPYNNNNQYLNQNPYGAMNPYQSKNPYAAAAGMNPYGSMNPYANPYNGGGGGGYDGYDPTPYNDYDDCEEVHKRQALSVKPSATMDKRKKCHKWAHNKQCPVL